jgi:hypothetical protein
VVSGDGDGGDVAKGGLGAVCEGCRIAWRESFGRSFSFMRGTRLSEQAATTRQSPEPHS